MMQREYDFIIIGGGTAGCLLARLLVEAQAGTVALIEAGDGRRDVGSPPDVRSVVPAFYPRTFGSKLDWAYLTEPQTGLNGRRIAWPRGKTLGGSSAINALIYLQAARADFDRWALNGCQGWDWQSITKKLPELGQWTQTDFNSRCPLSDLSLGAIEQPHPWSISFVQACVESGFAECQPWLQSADRTCGLFTLTQRNGRRQHTGQQLTAELLNDQLSVLRGVVVNRLHIEGDRVRSVEVLHTEAGFAAANAPIELRATRSVILCAGTIGSPSILQRSGVGSAKSLMSIGVEPKLDLPGVGANLQDHLVFPLIFRTRESSGLPARFDSATRRQYRGLQTGEDLGPLASNIAEAGSLFSIDSKDTPDFQVHFTPTHYLKYPARRAPMDHCTLAVTDLHPRSRGYLFISSTHPLASPRIDPAYLSDPEDVPRMLAAVEVVREMATSAALREVIVEEVLPGRRRNNASTLQRAIEMFAMSIYHPVGTCRMGTDPMSVVDPNLRVHGLSNLHIADASVLPDLPSANTQAAVLLVGRLAAIVLKDT